MTDFFLKLVGVFGKLGTVITIILAFFKDKIKLRIDNDTLKRKEATDLIKELYDGQQIEMKELRKQMETMRQKNADEIDRVKEQHQKELTEKDRLYSIELGKRDDIIREIIQLLPVASKEQMEAKFNLINKAN